MCAMVSQYLGGLMLLTFTLSVIFVYRTVAQRRQDLLLPPGPPQLDLAAGRVSGKDVIKTFKDCQKKYGPVFTLKRSYGPPTVIVVDYDAAMDILEKNGIHTADRPPSIAIGEIVGRGMFVTQMRAGPVHAQFRKGLSAALRPSMALKYSGRQEKHARDLLRAILTDSDKFEHHVSKAAIDTAVSIAYGPSALRFAPDSTTPTGSSPEKILAHTRLLNARHVSRMHPHLYLVNTFPFLAHLPSWLYWPRRSLESSYRETRALYRGIITGVQRAREANLSSGDERYKDAETSFAAYLKDNQAEFKLHDDQAAFLAGGIYGAASETTAGALLWVLVAAACHPDAQKFIQAQLDEVVGRDRPPAVSDESKLPAVVAFYLETLRWRPVAPGGVPHRSTKDIQWNGYTMPKGTMIFAHLWLIGRNENLFPDSDQFIPQRWLNTEPGSNEMSVRDDLKIWAYGYGRRVCPGMHVANRSLFVTVAMLLWAFEISEDPAHPIDPSASTSGLAVRPQPFKLKFKSRLDPEVVKRTLKG